MTRLIRRKITVYFPSLAPMNMNDAMTRDMTDMKNPPPNAYLYTVTFPATRTIKSMPRRIVSIPTTRCSSHFIKDPNLVCWPPL